MEARFWKRKLLDCVSDVSQYPISRTANEQGFFLSKANRLRCFGFRKADTAVQSRMTPHSKRSYSKISICNAMHCRLNMACSVRNNTCVVIWFRIYGWQECSFSRCHISYFPSLLVFISPHAHYANAIVSLYRKWEKLKSFLMPHLGSKYSVVDPSSFGI